MAVKHDDECHLVGLRLEERVTVRGFDQAKVRQDVRLDTAAEE